MLLCTTKIFRSKKKIGCIATKIYGAASVSYTAEASRQIRKLEEMGFGNLPVCMAKTQYSLSDNAKLLGRPEGFTITVRDVYVSAGAGFVVALTGAVMTMPGLPKVPAASQYRCGRERKDHRAVLIRCLKNNRERTLQHGKKN